MIDSRPSSPIGSDSSDTEYGVKASPPPDVSIERQYKEPPNISGLLTRINKLNAEIEQANLVINGVNVNVQDLKQTVTDLDRKFDTEVSEVKTNIKSNTDEIETLKQQLQELKQPRYVQDCCKRIGWAVLGGAVAVTSLIGYDIYTQYQDWNENQ